MGRRLGSVALLIGLWASLPRAAAQQHATVLGHVTDDTGAALPGVVVTMSGPRGDRTASTSTTGDYRFDAVLPERYRLTFAVLGFAEHSRPQIDVTDGATTRVDVTLQLALRAEVTVSGRSTFRNLAELELPEASLVGLAASASEGVVTARQLERRPVQRSGEIIEAVPGVSVTQHSGEGKANQYYLRGFNLDHGTDFSTTVAGVPLNLPTHAHGHGYTDANFLIPELVSGMQYFKGPYAADTGDFSSAGGVTINYASVLERPFVDATAGGQGWSRLLAAASPRFGGGHLLAAIETAHSDGPWKRPDDYRRFNAVLRYSRGDALNNLALTALAYRAGWNATDQAPRRATDGGLLSRFGGIDSTTGGDTSRLSGSAAWHAGSATARTRVSGYAVAYDLDLFSNFTYFLDDPVNGDQFHQADRRLTTGLRASHERLTHWSSRVVSYRFGVESRRDDIGLLGLYRTRNRERLSTVREDAVTQISGGVWSDADVRWTPWLRSIAGIRADGYRFHVAANLHENSGTAAAGLLSPKGSIVLGPWRGTEIYANAGYGFHSNDARGATMTVDPTNSQPAARVTPLARARGAEVGARTVALPGFQSTLAAWRLSLDSELVFVGDAGTTAASRPSERSGVEWTNVVRLGAWLTLDADLAWSRARFSDGDPAGNHVPGAPERVAAVGLSVDRAHRLFGSVGWNYFGPRPLVENNSVRSGATSLVHAQVGYRLSRRHALVLDAFNLLDARHSDVDYFYISRLPGEPSDGVEDVHTHPALPRTLRLGVTFRF
jgi:TonB dependent receptor/Carboxypeptidase regulatory-like domain/TonB-dependent Receptor Plug Domain